jgi:hypothetical protein
MGMVESSTLGDVTPFASEPQTNPTTNDDDDSDEDELLHELPGSNIGPVIRLAKRTSRMS